MLVNLCMRDLNRLNLSSVRRYYLDRCFRCEKKLADDDGVFDRPQENKGELRAENLLLLCDGCFKRKNIAEKRKSDGAVEYIAEQATNVPIYSKLMMSHGRGERTTRSRQP